MTIYRQKILDHYKNPRNSGELAKPDCYRQFGNPLCGDAIDLYLKIKDNKIKDVKFKAEGCAISVAAMSLLSEKLKGLAVKQALALDEQDILKMLGIFLSPVRLKCALLGLKTLQECLKQLPKK